MTRTDRMTRSTLAGQVFGYSHTCRIDLTIHSTRLTGSWCPTRAHRGRPAGDRRPESWEATMAGFTTVLFTFAAVTTAALGILFGAFLAISFAIRREDKVGTLTGRAPSRACRSARYLTQWHRIRWGRDGARGGRAIA